MVVTTRPARFDGRSPGTAESTWAAAVLADRATSLETARYRRLVVVSAHPDDETLGAAGLIARLQARGADVDVLVATDGEGSHPDSPTTSAAAIGTLRRDEMTRATAHLAPGATIDRLGLPDGHLADHEDELATAVGRLLDGGATTLVAAPWRADGHPDHEAVARAVARAAHRSGAALVEFPIWAWLWATPDDPRLRPDHLLVLRLDEREWQCKQRAIAEHRSQIASLGDDPGDRTVLTPTFLEHFRRRYEIFVPAGGVEA
ncbi:PIG-L deacetylase family protein [Nakamurella sp.]|uniref:PIG-L deacetylase family protein n=1 Tax=Nakamurella sp. TaxID=1869182 RepID=UPI0037850EA6